MARVRAVGREQVEQIAEIDVDLIADRNHRGEADRALRRPFDHAGDDGAGLRDDGEIALLRHPRREARVELRRRHQHAEAVRADQPQAGGARGAVRRFGERSRAVTEAGGDDDGRRRALRTGRRDGFRHRGGRHRDHHDIGRPGDGVDGFDGADAFDLGVVRIDHVNRPGKSGGDDVCDHVAADRRLARARADDGERARRDQPVQAIVDMCSIILNVAAASDEQCARAQSAPARASRKRDRSRTRANAPAAVPLDLPQCRHAHVMRVTDGAA